MSYRSLFAALMAALFTASFVPARADSDAAAPEVQAAPTTETAADAIEAVSPEPPQAAAEPEPKVVSEPEAPVKAVPKKAKGRLEKADSFLADADWEFDGFVAGGKDQEVRSMFYLNDLVYLNVGTEQGFTTGNRVLFYKRGQKVKDPQSGKLLGYEIRRTAVGQVTDHVAGRTCSVRILSANEAVEIGDLVRRND